MPISPAGTDAKVLVSKVLYALAELNIHFGRNKYISKTAVSEFLKKFNISSLKLRK